MDGLYDAIFGSGVPIKQCQSTSLSNNLELFIGRDTGDVDPALTAVMKGEPTATITTYDVAGFISVFGVVGASVSSGTVSLPYRKRAAGSTFAGTLSHFVLTGANAFGYPTIFTAQQDGEATATAEVRFLSTTGLANPLSSATSQTLSAQSYNAAYTLGGAEINDVQVPEVTAVTINTGLQVEAKYYNGSVFPTSCVITQKNPTIEITFADADAIDTWGPMFSDNDSQDAVAYFRKLSAGSTRVADATAEHCAFTLSDGIITVPDYSAQDTADGSGTILITGKSLAASATSAISFA